MALSLVRSDARSERSTNYKVSLRSRGGLGTRLGEDGKRLRESGRRAMLCFAYDGSVPVDTIRGEEELFTSKQ